MRSPHCMESYLISLVENLFTLLSSVISGYRRPSTTSGWNFPTRENQRAWLGGFARVSFSFFATKSSHRPLEQAHMLLVHNSLPIQSDHHHWNLSSSTHMYDVTENLSSARQRSKFHSRTCLSFLLSPLKLRIPCGSSVDIMAPAAKTPLSLHATCSMVSSTTGIMVCPRAEDTIRFMYSTQTVTMMAAHRSVATVMVKLGCTSTMNRRQYCQYSKCSAAQGHFGGH